MNEPQQPQEAYLAALQQAIMTYIGGQIIEEEKEEECPVFDFDAVLARREAGDNSPICFAAPVPSTSKSFDSSKFDALLAQSQEYKNIFDTLLSWLIHLPPSFQTIYVINRLLETKQFSEDIIPILIKGGYINTVREYIAEKLVNRKYQRLPLDILDREEKLLSAAGILMHTITDYDNHQLLGETMRMALGHLKLDDPDDIFRMQHFEREVIRGNFRIVNQTDPELLKIFITAIEKNNRKKSYLGEHKSGREDNLIAELGREVLAEPPREKIPTLRVRYRRAGPADEA